MPTRLLAPSPEPEAGLAADRVAEEDGSGGSEEAKATHEARRNLPNAEEEDRGGRPEFEARPTRPLAPSPEPEAGLKDRSGGSEAEAKGPAPPPRYSHLHLRQVPPVHELAYLRRHAANPNLGDPNEEERGSGGGEAEAKARRHDDVVHSDGETPERPYYHSYHHHPSFAVPPPYYHYSHPHLRRLPPFHELAYPYHRSLAVPYAAYPGLPAPTTMAPPTAGIAEYFGGSKDDDDSTGPGGKGEISAEEDENTRKKRRMGIEGPPDAEIGGKYTTNNGEPEVGLAADRVELEDAEVEDGRVESEAKGRARPALPPRYSHLHLRRVPPLHELAYLRRHKANHDLAVANEEGGGRGGVEVESTARDRDDVVHGRGEVPAWMPYYHYHHQVAAPPPYYSYSHPVPPFQQPAYPQHAVPYAAYPGLPAPPVAGIAEDASGKEEISAEERQIGIGGPADAEIGGKCTTNNELLDENKRLREMLEAANKQISESNSTISALRSRLAALEESNAGLLKLKLLREERAAAQIARLEREMNGNAVASTSVNEEDQAPSGPGGEPESTGQPELNGKTDSTGKPESTNAKEASPTKDKKYLAPRKRPVPRPRINTNATPMGTDPGSNEQPTTQNDRARVKDAAPSLASGDENNPTGEPRASNTNEESSSPAVSDNDDQAQPKPKSRKRPLTRVYTKKTPKGETPAFKFKIIIEDGKQRRRRLCSAEGCANLSLKKGVCHRHGAKFPCSVGGCTNDRVSGGKCIEHRVMSKRSSEGGGDEQSFVFVRNPRLDSNPAVKFRIITGTDGKQRKKRVCSAEGCNNFSMKAGVCARHGAKRLPCTIEGCTNPRHVGGICGKHRTELKHRTEGTKSNRLDATPGVKYRIITDPKSGKTRKKRLCSAEGCTNWCMKGGVCMRHGAVFPCSVEGCTNNRAHGGICVKHGARHKRCNFEGGCTNQSVSGGKCVRHGAKRHNYVCKIEGCTNQVIKRGLCTRHGAKGQCTTKGCVTAAAKGGLCVRHGAKVRRIVCDYDGCTNKRIVRGKCQRHDKECQELGAIIADIGENGVT